MGIVSKIIGRGKGGDSDEEELEGVDLSALDNLDEEIGGAIDRGLGETTETAQTVADTSPSEEGPGMLASLGGWASEPEIADATYDGMFPADDEPAAPDPMGVEAVLASNQDNSDWYGPQNAASPGGEERRAHPMMREDGHLPTLARIEGWEEPEEYLNEIELIDGATMVTVPEVADPGELFRSAFANREENSAKQAPPPPITGLEAQTGSGSDPWSEAEPASMAAPAPPPPPQAAQGSAVPDAYRVYQDEIAQARRKDRARKALSSIISLITGGVGVGMAARGRGNAAALAGLAGKVAQNAVPAPVREAQAQRDFAMRRQVDADGRAIQTQDRRDRIADRVAVDGLTERERHNRAMEETSARNAASLEQRRSVQNEGSEALNDAREIQSMDRETRRAFEYGEGRPELVQSLRDSEIENMRMAWEQLPDDDRSAAWASAIDQAEAGNMVPLDIRRAANAMYRAGSTRVRGRRRGSGGSGGGSRAGQPGQRSVMARDIAAWEAGNGGLAPGQTQEQRQAELENFSQRDLTSLWRSSRTGTVNTNIRDADQIETQVREVSRVLGNAGEYAIAVRNAYGAVNGMEPNDIRALMAGRAMPAGLRTADWANAHQAVEVLRLMRGKQLSGAAVSEAEREMIDQSMALAFSGDPAQLISSLRQMRSTVDQLQAGHRAGYSEEVMAVYDANMRREIARLRASVSAPGGSSTAPTPGRLRPRPRPAATPSAPSGGRTTVYITRNDGTVETRQWTRAQIESRQERYGDRLSLTAPEGS